jgi:hypothetical protein
VCWRASIAAARGEREEALRLLQLAISERVTYGNWLHNEPALDSLRGYPPFETLVRPR